MSKLGVRLVLLVGILVVFPRQFSPIQQEETLDEVMMGRNLNGLQLSLPPKDPLMLRRPRIGVLGLWVTKTLGKDAPRLDPKYFPHMINKACYADIWGYDFIFNTTWGFTPDYRAREAQGPGKCWLDWGHWHRVPKLKAMLESEKYDWVLWTDHDMLFNDLSIPLETLLTDLEMNNKTNVDVVLTDMKHPHKQRFITSSFSILIRNSKFGRRLVDNWLEFARGVCPNGNFPMPSCNTHDFQNNDQVGLWYALPKTWSELHRPDVPWNITCNPETGLRDIKGIWGAIDMHEYFENAGAVKSTNWSEIPDGEFRIILLFRAVISLAQRRMLFYTTYSRSTNLLVGLVSRYSWSLGGGHKSQQRYSTT